MKHKYTYSRLELFKQCPFRFKLKYIDKINKPINTEHLDKGSYIHWLIEHNAFNPYSQFKDNLDIVKDQDKRDSYKLIYENFIQSTLFQEIKELTTIANEIKWGLDIKTNPVDYYSDNMIIRGIIDYIAIKDDTLYIIDWKTGKVKNQEYIPFANQIALYALWAFKVFNFDKIIGKFVFVEHNQDITLEFHRDNMSNVAKAFGLAMATIEKETSFPCKPSPLCNWCEYENQECSKNIV